MSKARPRTNAEMVEAIAEQKNLSQEVVTKVLSGLADVVLADLSPRGPGRVTVAGLIKAEVVAVPARSERAGRNPATGEPITITARPANERGKIRLRPLKRLRDVL